MGALFIALALLAGADSAPPTLAVFEIHDARRRASKLPEEALRDLTSYLFARIGQSKSYRPVPRELFSAAEKALTVQIIATGPEECAVAATLSDAKNKIVEKVANAKSLCPQDALSSTLDEIVAQLSARDAKPPTRSELEFKKIAEAPKIDVAKVRASGIRGVNVEADQALERAAALEDDPDATPKDKAAAWCAAAKLKRNPYAEPTGGACRTLAAHSAEIAKLEGRFKADKRRLDQYLAAKAPALEQKLAAADAFREAYAELSARDEYKAVDEAVESMKRDLVCEQAGESCRLGFQLAVKKSKKQDASYPELPGDHPGQSFERFLGLARGDGLGRVKAVLGEPIGPRVKRSRNERFYFAASEDDRRRAYVVMDEDRLREIRIDADACPFVRSRRRAAQDPHLGLCGAALSEVVMHLGEPQYAQADRFTYVFAWGELAFLCPSLSAYRKCGISIRYLL
jgi:hypothetical protein